MILAENLFNANSIATSYQKTQDINNTIPMVGPAFFPNRKLLGNRLDTIKTKKGLSVQLAASNYDAMPTLRVRGTFSGQSNEMPFFRESMLVREYDLNELMKIESEKNPYFKDIIPKYSGLKSVMLCVSPNKGSSEVEQFGSTEDYDRTMTTADPHCPIDENAVLWVDGADTDGPYDYNKKRETIALNNPKGTGKYKNFSPYNVECQPTTGNKSVRQMCAKNRRGKAWRILGRLKGSRGPPTRSPSPWAGTAAGNR